MTTSSVELDYLTISQLAKRLHVCATTIRKSEIPFHRIGRQRLYDPAEVRAYFAANMSPEMPKRKRKAKR